MGGSPVGMPDRLRIPERPSGSREKIVKAVAMPILSFPSRAWEREYSSSLSTQDQLVFLLHDIQAPHAAGLLVNFVETCGAVEMGSGGEGADRPEDNASVAVISRELDCLVEQTLA